MTDPWRVLAEPAESPARADAEARQALGSFDADDPRRVAGLATWLVARAALDGSTAVPAPVVAQALRGYGVDNPGPGLELAVDGDRLVALLEEQALALPAVALAEEAVAEEGLRLLDERRLSLVVSRTGTAHRLGLSDLAGHLAAAGQGQALVLDGDPDALQPDGPGRPFADLVASGLFPVELRPVTEPDSALTRLLDAVRGGRLPPVAPGQREVVVVSCSDADEVIGRTSQLVTTSVPRLLDGVDALLLAVREDGSAGATALRSAVSGAEVTTVHRAVGRRACAVVLVLPAEASGSLTRALLVSALSVPERHISVVHQAGAALAEAVATRPHRPRLTRLPGLLREMGG